MNEKINGIAQQIRELQVELETELKKKQSDFFYRIENSKAVFEQKVINEGRAKIISSLEYLSSFSMLAVLTIPFIWAMMIPAFLVDIFVTIFQYICFPIYKIPKVKRSDYIVMDRYTLFYLDQVEKINCWYCEYFNGVIYYVREIAARTEQFWCPIKHSKNIKDKHSRYGYFFEYGDYATYRKELEERRSDFKDLKEKDTI
ncbi:MAG TPA: hypothetical protein CFH81_00880 [Sulfurovum sp. UBA12169]|nr:MAG TPA: hypothetical protein CFH81_00880 [Sulfurovum sp. UBA12169]